MKPDGFRDLISLKNEVPSETGGREEFDMYHFLVQNKKTKVVVKEYLNVNFS